MTWFDMSKYQKTDIWLYFLSYDFLGEKSQDLGGVQFFTHL